MDKTGVCVLMVWDGVRPDSSGVLQPISDAGNEGSEEVVANLVSFDGGGESLEARHPMGDCRWRRAVEDMFEVFMAEVHATGTATINVSFSVSLVPLD